MVSRIGSVEAKVKTLEDKHVGDSDPSMTVIVTNVPCNEGEHAQEISERILHEGLLECRRSLWFGPSD